MAKLICSWTEPIPSIKSTDGHWVCKSTHSAVGLTLVEASKLFSLKTTHCSLLRIEIMIMIKTRPINQPATLWSSLANEPFQIPETHSCVLRAINCLFVTAKRSAKSLCGHRMYSWNIQKNAWGSSPDPDQGGRPEGGGMTLKQANPSLHASFHRLSETTRQGMVSHSDGLSLAARLPKATRVYPSSVKVHQSWSKLF